MCPLGIGQGARWRHLRPNDRAGACMPRKACGTASHVGRKWAEGRQGEAPTGSPEVSDLAPAPHMYQRPLRQLTEENQCPPKPGFRVRLGLPWPGLGGELAKTSWILVPGETAHATPRGSSLPLTRSLSWTLGPSPVSVLARSLL